MLRIFLAMAGLGLAAVDPIGIAIMPLLLMREQPIRRSVAFLAGSLLALMIMGVAFAWGLGRAVLRIEQAYPWLLPYGQVIAGIILLAFAVGMAMHWWRHRQTGMEPPKLLAEQLQLKLGHIMAAGAALVVAQSLADVVFVVAMVHVGQQYWHLWKMASAVFVYSVAALALQIGIVCLYCWLPAMHRERALKKLRGFIGGYAEPAAIVASVIIALVLLRVGLPASLRHI